MKSSQYFTTEVRKDNPRLPMLAYAQLDNELCTLAVIHWQVNMEVSDEGIASLQPQINRIEATMERDSGEAFASGERGRFIDTGNDPEWSHVCAMQCRAEGALSVRFVHVDFSLKTITVHC